MTDTDMDDLLQGCSAVIFDWDGTLADTQERNYQALCTAATPHHITIDRAWYTQHAGLPIHELLRCLTGNRTVPIDQIINTSRTHLLATTSPDTIIPIACAVDLAHQARHRGLPCAVASGAATVLVETGLQVLNLRSTFEAVVGRDEVTQGKPAPDVFLEAASRLNRDPDQCLAVEDSPDGATAAQRAGMRLLLVRNGRLRRPHASTGNSAP